MLRIAGLCAALFATGCAVETPGSGSDVVRNDRNGRLCATQLTVSGAFMQSKAPPVHEDGAPYTGCWPIGVWTFAAQRGTGDCGDGVDLLPQYQFRVEERFDADGNPYQVNTYMTDPSTRHRVKVSQGGAGLCTGELNLFSADGTEVWIIKPALYADGRLGGDGEYSLYGTDQWIGDSN